MKVGVIGAGQAGSALAHGLARAGHDVRAVASRTREPAEALATAVGAAVAGDAVAAAKGVDLVVLATPDAVLAGVVGDLAAAGAFDASMRVVHLSGVLALDVLEPAARAGARTGVLHPVTPLADAADPSTLRGKPMGIETAGDPGWLRDLVGDLGGRAVDLTGVDRYLYHAAAVISSNLVVAIVAAAEEVFEAAGVSGPDAAALTTSLVTSSATQIAALGVEQALTGPARRGDAAVLAAHRDALDAVEPELAELYRLVSRRILRLLPDGDVRLRTHEALAPAPSEPTRTDTT